MSVQASVEQGFRALDAWSWEEARATFDQIVSDQESAEALEGLGVAAFWLDDGAAAIAARERAYRLYRDRGDAEAAARVAAGLADAVLTFRGEPAVAAGWLETARRVLSGHPDSPILAWVDTLDAFVAMSYERDVARALAIGEDAVARTRALGDLDVETVARSVFGVVLVSCGRFAEGMRMLDEATAAVVSGDVRSPDAAGNVWCALVSASVRVRDLDRLAQWSQHVIDLSGQWRSPVMVSYPRTEHAVALTWWGRWEEAERELEAVIENPGDRPLMAALAKLRLADLRRRQGRFADAQALLRELQGEQSRIGQGHLTGAVAAAVELDRGDPAKAVELAERYLRAVPPDDVVERPDGLDVLARARIALGDADRAAAAAKELAAVAERVPTSPFRAAASLAAGLVARARGEAEEALEALEETADLFAKADAPFEGGRARVELGRVLLDLGRPDAAAEETHKALAAFEALGADRDAETTRAALEAFGAPRRRERADLPLTPREAEVLRLLASGRSNEQIAAELVLSVRTVERHISNIYAKIGAHGRTARAVATAYAHTHALT